MLEDMEAQTLNNPEELLKQARQLRQQHRHLESIACAEKALSLFPESALSTELHFEIGSSALSTSHWQQAHTHLNACLVSEPVPAVLYHRLGRASQELGQLQSARDYYQQALKARSGSKTGKTWHQLGRVNELLGENEAAIAAYEQAIISFKATNQLCELGISAFQLGSLQQALKHWERAEQAFDLTRQQLDAQAELRAEACYRLAETAIQTEAFAKAEEMLAEALMIHRQLKNQSGLGLCLLKLCQVLMLQRRWKEVISTVQQAIEALENSREDRALKLAYELQGELLQLLGKNSEAQVWLDRASQLANSADSGQL